MFNTIDDHIESNINELWRDDITKQRRRFLESELDCLLKYKANHPNETENPTSLHLLCDEFPDLLECRVYDC